MTGKTHAACGAATMLALTVLHRSGLPIGAETYTPALGLLTVVVGSYAPDVDLKNSGVVPCKCSRKIPKNLLN